MTLACNKHLCDIYPRLTTHQVQSARDHRLRAAGRQDTPPRHGGRVHPKVSNRPQCLAADAASPADPGQAPQKALRDRRRRACCAGGGVRIRMLAVLGDQLHPRTSQGFLVHHPLRTAGRVDVLVVRRSEHHPGRVAVDGALALLGAECLKGPLAGASDVLAKRSDPGVGHFARRTARASLHSMASSGSV